jgi:hypothetical protein
MFSLDYHRHTEGTAGLASLIGTSQALQHGIIPPNMHFNKLHPRVEPFYTHLEVPTEAKDWPSPVHGQPRRASVHSFGEILLFFFFFFKSVHCDAGCIKFRLASGVTRLIIRVKGYLDSLC